MGAGATVRPLSSFPQPDLMQTTTRRNSKMSRSIRDDRGAALVEFALVVPVLLMVLMGIVEFGRAYNTQLSIEAAAREGVRELALDHTNAAATTAITDRDGSANLQASNITLTRCPAQPWTATSTAKVDITKQFSFDIPLMPAFSRTLTAKAVMRCGL
jgi:Flp pilus assembly protein TadG